jgi:molybdenum cofactor guanylyltransferase
MATPSPAATASPRPINGLILAGGHGRRMANKDKGLLLFNHTPFIEHCIARLQPQVHDIFISANRNIAQYQHYGFKVLRDEHDDFQGPLAGLFSALCAAPQSPLLVVPCDAPLLPTNLAQRLVAAYEKENEKPLAVIPHDGTRLQPLFGLYAATCRASLQQYLTTGQRKVGIWATSLPHVMVDFSDEPENFSNINSPEALLATQALVPQRIKS